MGILMNRAGAGVPSANRITLLRDTNGDGVADQRSTLIEGLNSPSGMALVGDWLYVANTDALVRFPYRTGTPASPPGRRRSSTWPAAAITGHAISSPRPTANVSMSRSVPPRTSPRTASTRKARSTRPRPPSRPRSSSTPPSTPAPRSSRWCPKPGRRASSPGACATRTAWPSSRIPAICGPSSTSATCSAPTCRPTI